MSSPDPVLSPFPGDQSKTEESDDPVSAGELGKAVDANGPASDAGQAEVVIGEIPDADDPTQLVWTARCTFPPHGQLGSFDTQELAERAKSSHLLVKHGRRD
jgi:hypothetical protein